MISALIKENRELHRQIDKLSRQAVGATSGTVERALRSIQRRISSAVESGTTTRRRRSASPASRTRGKITDPELLERHYAEHEILELRYAGVAPEHRGQGIFATLVAKVLARLVPVIATVPPQNRSNATALSSAVRPGPPARTSTTAARGAAGARAP